jgi:NAD+-processing family protein with receiver domain
MSYRLFLDDERAPKQVTWVALPPGPWTVVKSYTQFVDTIMTRGIPMFVSFDHDLADEHYRAAQYMPYPHLYTDRFPFKEKTGKDCAYWLVERCLETKTPIPEYQVHSMNPVGRYNIISVMMSGLKVQGTL